MDVDLAVILQGVSIAVLVWFGRKVQTLSETVAVHEYRLTDHARRISGLE
jgi:hypothetical protein